MSSHSDATRLFIFHRRALNEETAQIVFNTNARFHFPRKSHDESSQQIVFSRTRVFKRARISRGVFMFRFAHRGNRHSPLNLRSELRTCFISFTAEVFKSTRLLFSVRYCARARVCASPGLARVVNKREAGRPARSSVAPTIKFVLILMSISRSPVVRLTVLFSCSFPARHHERYGQGHSGS